MPLPSSRNTTYSAGSQVLSADLNDLQDMIVGGLHGEVERVVHASAMEGNKDMTGGGAAAMRWELFSSSDEIVLPLTMPLGAVLTEIDVWCEVGASGKSISFQLCRPKDGTSNAYIIGTETLNYSAGATEKYSFTTGLPLTVEPVSGGSDDTQVGGTAPPFFYLLMTGDSNPASIIYGASYKYRAESP